MEAITVQKTPKYYTTKFDLENPLNPPTTTIVAPPRNVIKWQMGFNSAFKGLQSMYQNFQFTGDKLIRTNLVLKRGAPSRAGPGAVVPFATLKRRLWVPGISRG
jgi:hypothetical protein